MGSGRHLIQLLIMTTIKKAIAEIIELLEKKGGHAVFKTNLIVKKSPHTPPVKIREISLDYDFDSESEIVIYSILQRLKMDDYDNNAQHNANY